MDENFYKVYRHGKEYVGTPLILKGAKRCPLCKGNMVKIPVKVPYVDKVVGYYPVSISQVSGRMTLFEGDVETIWVCDDGCKNRK